MENLIGMDHKSILASRRKLYRSMSARGVVVRLLPRHPVYLFTFEGGGARFAELFRGTWARLPLGARRHILRYWRSENPYTPWDGTVKVELATDWDGRRRGRGLRGTRASMTWGGYQLYFFTKVVEALPDELVRDLIAHELAHVYQ
jgi:hypothetical protein